MTEDISEVLGVIGLIQKNTENVWSKTLIDVVKEVKQKQENNFPIQNIPQQNIPQQNIPGYQNKAEYTQYNINVYDERKQVESVIEDLLKRGIRKEEIREAVRTNNADKVEDFVRFLQLKFNINN